ncbi:MAG: hypothetical protein LBH59_11735 [Planctomycetaceae bacterium]|nr:hypothetical protein [Planctomycetaceae bacterium]
MLIFIDIGVNFALEQTLLVVVLAVFSYMDFKVVSAYLQFIRGGFVLLFFGYILVAFC